MKSRTDLSGPKCLLAGSISALIGGILILATFIDRERAPVLKRSVPPNHSLPHRGRGTGSSKPVESERHAESETT
jgi:hypothetical protein